MPIKSQENIGCLGGEQNHLLKSAKKKVELQNQGLYSFHGYQNYKTNGVISLYICPQVHCHPKSGSMKIAVQNKRLFNPSQVLTILKPQCHTKTITDYSTILVMRNIWQELEG